LAANGAGLANDLCHLGSLSTGGVFNPDFLIRPPGTGAMMASGPDHQRRMYDTYRFTECTSLPKLLDINHSRFTTWSNSVIEAFRHIKIILRFKTNGCHKLAELKLMHLWLMQAPLGSDQICVQANPSNAWDVH